MSESSRDQRLQSLLHGYLQAVDRGENPNRQELLDAHPDLRDELAEYFAGDRTRFTLPLPPLGTAFPQAVWQELIAIPFGETVSYGELARRIGNPQAMRAVGLANGRNPVSIVVPCHRVIGADGTLTGYGGGIERKVFLLAMEAQAKGFASSERRTPAR